MKPQTSSRSVPKDIVINATVGTSIPNPILSVMVLGKRMATDFEEMRDKELEERGNLVKKGRGQQFRNDVHSKLDALLEY